VLDVVLQLIGTISFLLLRAALAEVSSSTVQPKTKARLFDSDTNRPTMHIACTRKEVRYYSWQQKIVLSG